MNLAEWFRDQLQFGMEGFLWAMDQMPAERCYLSPPQPLGEWTTARHLFHTHDVLSLALFWDAVVEYLRRTGSR